METYQSKTVVIKRPAEEIFRRLNRLDSLTPMAEGRLEGWQADADSCSFRVQGFTVGLHVAQRVEPSLIQLTSQKGTPFDFGIELRLDQTQQSLTQLDMSVNIELNPVLKMMVGSRLQQGADSLAEMIAAYMNSLPE